MVHFLFVEQVLLALPAIGMKHFSHYFTAQVVP